MASKVDWGSKQRCFIYATDSQVLHKLVCGHLRVRDHTYTPLITRILDRIVDHLGKGWTPPRLSHDPVQWWKRCHNKVADGLADLTMDGRRTWTKQFPTTLSIGTSNVVIQTDGGRREGDCSAAAWIIGLWGAGTTGSVFEPLMVHGTYLHDEHTAFGTEAIALDEASRAVADLLTNHTVANG